MFLLPFHVVGVTHEANAADLVGRLRLSPEQVSAALAELHQRQVPALILSTCHRTELYWWGDEELLEWFSGIVLHNEPALRAHAQFTQHDADLAVRHLFSVAAGMKSVRFGEPEILGQLRRAWALARTGGTSHGYIDDTFRHAIEAARHVRAAMGHEGDSTLGAHVQARLSAALGSPVSGHRQSGHLQSAHVLVVGSGDAARGVLEALRQRPIAGVEVHVSSRTDARAEALAREFGLPVVPWDDRERAMREADAVVFAVHVTSPLIGAGFAASMPPRLQPALWVDLGVPAAVDAAFACAQVELVTLERLADALEADGRHATGHAFHAARQRRAAVALQQELARYARDTHRHQLGAKLGALEEQALAVATSFRDAPVDEMVRKVTRLVWREFSRA